MTQNIYDNLAFFTGYSQLPRSIEGLDGAPEWPALRALLPPIRGLRVLDLGCGFGWFCRWAAGQGASHALGLDVSENMLARARADTKDERIIYERADLEQLGLPAGAFDLAYSSLALHYIEHLAALFATVGRALVSTGMFVFSVEHPIYTAPARPGWSVDGRRKIWPVDDYLAEGPRTTDWLAKGVIKQHRTIGTYVNMLIRTGFQLTHLEEWGPSEGQIAARPTFADDRLRPPFLLVAARRA
jgi:SAM-dependent methyltransferase